MSEQRISSNADTFVEGGLPLDGASCVLKSLIYKRHALKGQPERTYLRAEFYLPSSGKTYEQFLGLGGGGNNEPDRYMPANGGGHIVAAPGQVAKPLSKQSKGGFFLSQLQAKITPELKAILDDDVRKLPALKLQTKLEVKIMDFKDKKVKVDLIHVESFDGLAGGNGAAAAADPAFASKVEGAIREIIGAKGGKVSANALPGALFNGTWFATPAEKTAASTLATNADFLRKIEGLSFEGGIIAAA